MSIDPPKTQYELKTFCSKHLGECNGGEERRGNRVGDNPRSENIYQPGTRSASAKSDFDMPPVGLAATTRHGGSGGGRRFGYFLDRINPGNRYYHKVHVFLVSRPKARTATGHRFDLANPKDGDACGSESTCSGCSRPTIEVGDRHCCTDLIRALFREASSHRLVLYWHDGLPTDGLPEGPNTSTRTLPRDPGGKTSSEALARIVSTNPDGLDSLLIPIPFEPSARLSDSGSTGARAAARRPSCSGI